MFCPECGTENPEGAKFCGNCRHQLSASTNDPIKNPVNDVVEIDQGQPTVPDGMKYGILAASIFIPFIGLIMGIIYLAQGESEEKKDVGKLWLYVSLGIMLVYFIISSDM
ncbi:zinc-ribbon domain-containing protein [Sedimenticola selenatireducens]|uniref:Zinc-ribbon domain-containing protein n=1 Tax=Sedimenticola selenatireducens TaxID=191960 RepID=A0A557SHN8_9GAMM|nr:zinc ribbon domain-containing protein [Sedimenticola selenatireducens]TVO76927.1 zinc-ribbon domain-containing protein [Sedimenticola selenatireducens]TVT64370.1 MAG: zinc-ribbon domain-containing protein [Sedimenticola selenatireducens]